MTAPAFKPRRNRGRLILVGALALSLLGNAVTVGAVLQFNRMRHALLGPEAQSAIFPREYRRDLNAALKAHDDALRADLATIVAARSALVETAMARPFDRASTEAAMTLFRDRVTSTIANVQAVLLDALEERGRQGE